ncbi:hypothetical protein BO78DRAFT_469442 [Aspergillus sclerotiicarbonarius CBS 121057]|uniref:MJ1316 RNA cyclic group end recognition domain-containing protein n=1 Tax=Aspergillus sclerotiicarbonarius (strain CBS 121057 / IBT 28362) TaxID=1448318 RepID=A0A319ET96_ASPSB|nr:hypothetical protein BO78DRAFT_469442 [Aspergillus sclerotiicarbonarius CBS 121057]
MASDLPSETQQGLQDIPEQGRERTPTPQPETRTRTPTPTPETDYPSFKLARSKPEPVENRLRPAADIINRIIWDPAFDPANYIIGYEDRFEGRLEAGFNSWKKETTDEEFIPQHRILYIKRTSDGEIIGPLIFTYAAMTSRRHRIDFSLRRRRNDPSLTSSGSVSPTVPVLQSPVTFQAFATVNVSEATLKQKNKLERSPVRPSMFLEEKDDDETPVPALVGGAPVDVKSAHVERKSVEEKPMTRTKSQYFEDAFSTRGPLCSPRSQISQDSVVVVEIKINTKVKELESLVSNISSHMARIFQKSETLMMTTIQEEACIHFGRSSLPAYLMKVFALPYLIAPITNLRSTILIQAALQEIIHVAPSRGVILYIPISEENFATNGVTMMGELARLERSSPDHGPGLFKNLSRTMSRRLKSSSSQSTPISVATTSSWACGGDGTQASSMTGKESQCSDALKNEGKQKSGTKPKGLRHFLSRQGSERLQQPVRSDPGQMESSSARGRVSEIQGNIFDAPDGAGLIHACNCRGSWGKGIAKAFRERYPAAYEIYRSHCRKCSSGPRYNYVPADGGTRKIRAPEGTALIIPPQKKDYEAGSSKRHWIICLFTSRGFGRKVSPEDIILKNTELAVADMQKQLGQLEGGEVDVSELWSCQFNSGLFGVEWAHSKDILERSGLNITVVSPKEE